MRQLLSLLGIFSLLIFIAAEPAVPDAPADGPDVVVDGGDDAPSDPSDQPDPADVPMVEGKIYQSWVAYGVGTTVTTKTTIVSNGQTIVADAVTTLEGKDENKAKLNSTITLTQNEQTQQIPAQPGTEYARVPQGQEYAPEGFNITPKEAGTESITIEGKAFECRVIEFDGNSPVGPVKGKLWVNDQVPGAHVKITMDVQNGMMQWEFVVVKFETK